MLEPIDFNDDQHNPKYTLQDALDVLKNNQSLSAAALSYGLSSLSSEDVSRFKEHWSLMPNSEREGLIQHLIEVSEANFELDYQPIAHAVHSDSSAVVREAAIELLWEDQRIHTMHMLIDTMLWDAETNVRAKAAQALGRFVLEGEYGNLPDEATAKVQEAIVQVWENRSESQMVRRRALESISNSSHTIVPDAIQEAYSDRDIHVVASSLYAMGKSCDPIWVPQVVESLEHLDGEIRYEAVKASGELEIESVVPQLVSMVLDDERQIQEAAIWSLGEIGSSKAVQVLNELMDNEQFQDDEVFQVLLEDALASADLKESFGIDFDLDGDDWEV